MSITQNLSDREFYQLKDFIYKKSGIKVTNENRKHLEHKLKSRLEALGLDTYDSYYKVLLQDSNEAQAMINVVTTNETYFFREKRHLGLSKKKSFLQ
jgi:chemotaxis protein methyltransferase CheR